MTASLLTTQQENLLKSLFKILALIHHLAPAVEAFYPDFVFGCYSDLIISYGDRLLAIETSADYEQNFPLLRDDVLNLFRSAMIFTNRNEPPPPEVFNIFHNRDQR